MRAFPALPLLALLSAPAGAETSAGLPAPEAIELAGLVWAASTSIPRTSTRQMELRIVGELLGTWTSRGPGCDPALEACRNAATQMARQLAPARLAEERRRFQIYVACRLEESMSEAEMREAARFLRGGTGGKLILALARIAAPPEGAERSKAMSAWRRALAAVPEPRRDHVERFYQQTRHLPRRPVPVPPPAPPAPPPPPRSD